MVELVVVATDLVNGGDFYRNCQVYKRGMVIDWGPDGADWGPVVLGNPNWLIVSLPAETSQTVSVLLTPEMPVDPLAPSPTLRRRGFRLDLDNPALQPLIISGMTDPLGLNPVTQPAKGVETSVSLAILTLQCAPIADPNQAGSPPNVLGAP